MYMTLNIFATLDQDDHLGSLAPCCSTLQAEIIDKYETVRKIREHKVGGRVEESEPKC